MTEINEDDYLAHYGILRRSGRYPWGSGENPSQRSSAFFQAVDDLKKKGLTEQQIAQGFGMTTTQLRNTNSIARAEQKLDKISRAQQLKDRGYSNSAIGRDMGINESSVRSLLEPGQADKAMILKNTAEMLRNQVAEKEFIDIGSGVENHIGLAKDKFATAVSILKDEGYAVHTVQIDQIGTGKKTNTKVLAPPGTTYRDIVMDRGKISHIQEFTQTGGRDYDKIQRPLSIDSKRVKVNYAEDGGADLDGVIFVRPGKEDVSLGGSNYAQVRIAVDGTHYLKGMAMYKDDLPKGVDLQFNTNKSKNDPKRAVEGDKFAMKKMEPDPDNPFGSSIRRQITDKDKKLTSAMNMVNEEGQWETWSRSLSTQMLSKQSPKLIRQQLDMTYDRKKAELDEIMALTNPAVKKKLLETYAAGADSSAVHMKAASLPRQASHVILPLNALKPSEVYAPNYRNGERVVLIRHPHGGIFEIPELVVNNNNPTAKKLLGRAPDAIGIHSDVAKRLSGADFDGDTVIVIPNNSGAVKTKSPLKDLEKFDPQREYKMPEGTEFKGNKQRLMGDVSNLITDMTIKGASDGELARAVKHSMVVIDAEKHNLDYKRSAQQQGIKALKIKYQGERVGEPGRGNSGASTLISRAKGEVTIRKRKDRPAAKGGPVDPDTGKRMYVDVGEPYVNKQGKTVYPTQKVRKLDYTDDAHTLSSGTDREKIYADHSNKLKDLANTARKEAYHTQPIPYNPSAKRAYAKEVKELDAALNKAISNRPLERQAQIIAAKTVEMRRQANPNLDDDQIKKIRFSAMQEARHRTGAEKQQIDLSDDQWKAIQAGAITNHKLTQILNNAKLERVKELATPKRQVLMSSSKTARAQSMLAQGYTQAEVADHLGVSLTTLKDTLR